MTSQQHASRAHALLGASKAEQWLNCTPSAKIQEDIEDTRSSYADEGTLAHEIAEVRLRQKFFEADPNVIARENELMLDSRYNAEMNQAVSTFIEAVEEAFMEAKAKTDDAMLILEQRLDFSEWVPDGFGTGDVIIIADDMIQVIDLKYGKGVPVSAEDNSQLKLYGLGALNEFGYLYRTSLVRMTIVQPRLDYIGSYDMTVDALLHWGDYTVKPKADMAYKGEGTFVPGGHCKWCKVKATCRARADENMKVLAYEFRSPDLLSLDEISSLLHLLPQVKAWATDVENFAYDSAVRGVEIEGWKLVAGKSNRSITDKEAAISILESAQVPNEDYLKPRDLFGIGELEKRVGKKELANLIGSLIEKPQGKPVLVPETDKRPALNSVDNDFQNIGMEAI